MSFDAHANLATSLLTNSPGTAGTTFNVTTGTGALFPAVPFNCLVVPANTLPTTSNAEIVRCTAYTTDSFTVTRAQEGTTAVNAVAGYVFFNVMSAKVFTDIEGSIPTVNATPTGLVGTTAVAAITGFYMDAAAAPAINQAMAPTWTAIHTFEPTTQNNTTPVEAMAFINPTAANSGKSTGQSPAPYLLWQGNVYNSTSGTAQTYAARIYMMPVKGATPTANLVIGFQANGGTWTDQYTFPSGGTPTFASLNLNGGGVAQVTLGASGLNAGLLALYDAGLTYQLQIQSADASNTATRVLSFQLNDANRTLSLKGNTTISTTPVAFASLPGGPSAGDRNFVTNSSTNTFNAAADGAGSNTVPVWYNGSSWRVG